MTEERFEQIIENAADKFDKSVNRAWNRRPVRIAGKTVSFLTGAGLIAGAVSFAGRDNHTAAKICLISGVLVFLSEILQLIIFKKALTNLQLYPLKRQIFLPGLYRTRRFALKNVWNRARIS